MAYDKRITRRLPRESLAPIGPAPVDDETPPGAEEAARPSQDERVTLHLCPLCRGAGMVTPEVAVTFEALTESAREST